MKCRNCNAEIKDGSLFCTNCGSDLKVTPPVGTIKKDGSSNKVIIAILIILAIGIIGTTTYFVIKYINQDKPQEETNNNNNNNSNNTNINSKNKTSKNSLTGETEYYNDVDVDKLLVNYEDDISKNIKIEKMIYVPKDNSPVDVYVLAKNDNDFAIKTDFTFDFLDKNDVRVDKKYDDNMVVSPGQKFVTSLTNLYSTNDFVKQRLSIKVSKLKSYEHSLDLKQTDLIINEHDNQLDIGYKNTIGNKMEICVSIIYYKDGNIYFVDSLSLFPYANTEEKASFYFGLLPDSNYENQKPFDKYEIIVSGAKYSDNTY